MFEFNEQNCSRMSGLFNLNRRLDYYGGCQRDRMIRDKLWTLKKSILYSYQSGTIAVRDDKTFEYPNRFQCLINPDKLKPDYDNKIISIPYNAPIVGEDQKIEVPTNVKPGSVFYWEDTGTYWIVYLQEKTELAYFRAEIRQCKKEVEINGHIYKVYFRGPVETQINWRQKSDIAFNDLNYTAIIYITKNEETLDYFHRFKEIKIDDKLWETQVVNPESGDGVLEVNLKETFTNSIAEQIQKEEESQEPLPPVISSIVGELEIYPGDIKSYTFDSPVEDGIWAVNNSKVRIIKQTKDSATIEVVTSKSGNFKLSYLNGNDVIESVDITIKSL